MTVESEFEGTNGPSLKQEAEAVVSNNNSAVNRRAYKMWGGTNGVPMGAAAEVNA